MTDVLAIDVIDAQEAPLSSIEQKKLAALEKKLERYWVQSYLEIGTVLAEIKRAKLYRDTHETWAQYCRDRWNIGDNFADKQIRAAEAVAIWSGTDVPIPPFEAQARVLTRVKDDQERTDTWKSMLERHGGPPPAEIMRAELCAAPEKEKSAAKLAREAKHAAAQEARRLKEKADREAARERLEAEWASDRLGDDDLPDFDLPDSDEGTSDFDPLTCQLEQLEPLVLRVVDLVHNGHEFADEDLPRWASALADLSEVVPALVDA